MRKEKLLITITDKGASIRKVHPNPVTRNLILAKAQSCEQASKTILLKPHLSSAKCRDNLVAKDMYGTLREKFLKYCNGERIHIDLCMLHRVMNLLHHELEITSHLKYSLDDNFRPLIRKLLGVYHLIKSIYDAKDHEPEFCLTMVEGWHNVIYTGFLNIFNVDEMYHYLQFQEIHGFPDRVYVK